MNISRRDFIKYCSVSAATLGLSAMELSHLEQAMANPNGPTVLWMTGAGCSGCTVSFLNRISSTAPVSAADLLINYVNLAYHPELSAAAGESAVSIITNTYNKGGYVLVVEGAVPTAFQGATCFAYTHNGVDVTFLQMITSLSQRAAAIVCIGNCASFGGAPASGPNPTGCKSVSTVSGKKTINVAGCPPHPDWVVWTLAQLISGTAISTDSYGRPTQLYGRRVHGSCPRREHEEADRFGQNGLCLKEIGCRGPETNATCPSSLWNNGVNWCIGANAPCIGCTDPAFPYTPIFSHGD